MKSKTPLYFPSGLSEKRAKQRAKASVKSGEFSSLTEALNGISHKEMGVSWSKSVTKLKPKLRMMTRDDIADVMRQLPDLTHFGFGSYNAQNQTYQQYLKNVEDDKVKLLNAVTECNRACEFIHHLKKRKTINRRMGSYGLKHEAEYFLRQRNGTSDEYLSNGSFLCAAHFMGFTISNRGYRNPNACINVSMESPVIRWRRIIDENTPSTLSVNELRELCRLEKELGLPESEWVSEYKFLIQ